MKRRRQQRRRFIFCSSCPHPFFTAFLISSSLSASHVNFHVFAVFTLLTFLWFWRRQKKSACEQKKSAKKICFDAKKLGLWSKSWLFGQTARLSAECFTETFRECFTETFSLAAAPTPGAVGRLQLSRAPAGAVERQGKEGNFPLSSCTRLRGEL